MVKASYFRQHMFQYMDEVRDSGSSLEIERGKEIYVLKAKQEKKPIGTVEPRPWIAQDLEELPSFSPSQWTADDLS